MKLSSLTKRERALAERIAGGPLQQSSDAAVLGVGFVVARRQRPTVSLHTYSRKHDAAAVRNAVEWVQPAKKAAAKKAPAKKTSAGS